MIEEDFQAWEAYKHISYRWAFNKMEVAMKQGLHAGPAGTAPEYSGTYVSRPIYNLYGMGIGAKKFEYDSKSMLSRMINNDIVPPGHFWCQWLPGEHLSIDYEKDGSRFDVRSVWRGDHHSEENLVRFKEWTRLDNDYAETPHEMVERLRDFVFIYHGQIQKVNIEMRGNYIIDFHFRWGNDPFDDLPVGTTVVPVWNDEEAPEGEWRGNLHKDMEQYSASGWLEDVRRGYVIRAPQNQYEMREA